MKNDIAIEEVRRLFDYNPDTGIMTRKIRTACRTQAGDVVGYLVSDQGRLRVTVTVGGNRVNCYVHRLIWAWVHGEYPDDYIDHINGISSDNRLANLRAVPHKINMRNKSIPSNNTSGTNGVHWDKFTDKWIAQLQVDGKHKWLGRHNELDDAIKARKQAEVKYDYHENHGRVAL